MVVSGATYSSRGIISAVKNALTGEKDTSTSPAAGGTGGGIAAAGSGKDHADGGRQRCRPAKTALTMAPELDLAER